MRKALLVLFFGFFPLWVVLFLLAAARYTSVVPHISADSASWLFVVAVLSSVATLTLSLIALRPPGAPGSSSRLPEDEP